MKWLAGFDWRGKVRWFAAEYLIIVLGVLTAGAVNSAWKERQDGQREAVYLRQLAGDLSQTLANLSAVDSTMASRELASAKLLHAFQTAEPPARDSVLVWLDGLIQGGRPSVVIGTAEALVATGDIALLSDSLQLMVPSYIAFIREYQNYIDNNFVRRNTHMDGLERHVDFVEAERAVAMMGRTHTYDDQFKAPNAREAVRTAFPLDVGAFLDNREAYAHVRGIFLGLRAMSGNRSGIRSGTEDFLEKVQADLSR